MVRVSSGSRAAVGSGSRLRVRRGRLASVALSRRACSLYPARVAAESFEFAAAAARVQALARVRAAAVADTHGYERSIRRERVVTRQGVRDFFVFSDHPAALSIERGAFHYFDKAGRPLKHSQRLRAARKVFQRGKFVFSGVAWSLRSSARRGRG